MLKPLQIWLISSLLLGCGFHLRGTIDMPLWLNQIALVNEQAHHDLEPQLENQLKAYHIALRSPTQASYILIIEADKSYQQITNVAASTAPRQYTLFYEVRFKLIKAKGATILPSSQITVTRQLTVNSNRILGSDAEETTLFSEMRKEAALQIINRLSLAGRNGHKLQAKRSSENYHITNQPATRTLS